MYSKCDFVAYTSGQTVIGAGVAVYVVNCPDGWVPDWVFPVQCATVHAGLLQGCSALHIHLELSLLLAHAAVAV